MKPWQIWLLLLVVVGLLVAPLAYKGSVYTAMMDSSDAQAHMGVIVGSNSSILYYGQRLLGMVMFPFRQSVSVAYPIFAFAVLGLAALVIFGVVWRMSNMDTGIIAVIVMFLVATPILALFKYGVIFNIVNVYILLPLIFLLCARTAFGNLWYGVALAGGVVLYSVLHSTSYYLKYATTPVFGILCVAFPSRLLKWVGMGATILLVNLLMIRYFIAVNPPVGEYAENGVIQAVSGSGVVLIVRYLTVPVIVAAIIVVCNVRGQLFALRDDARVFVVMALTFGASLSLGAVLRIIQDYNRLALDAAGMLALGIAVLVGQYWKQLSNASKGVMTAMFLFGATQNMWWWLH